MQDLIAAIGKENDGVRFGAMSMLARMGEHVANPAGSGMGILHPVAVLQISSALRRAR